MSRLENVSVATLRQALRDAEGATATLRIVVGINYKEGVSQTDLARWYDVSRTTIHNWLARLERLESEPLEDVVYDDDRPGRPPKLDAAQREQFRAVLDGPPAAAGFDAASWSPTIARAFLAREFGVEYTIRHVRQLLTEVRHD